jgi:hypothetical protein
MPASPDASNPLQTAVVVPDAEPEHSGGLGFQLDEIARRAADGGLIAERINDERGQGIRLRFGEQRGQRTVQLVRTEQWAREFLGLPFEFVRMVPDYQAVFDARDGSVEARLVSAGRFLLPRSDALSEAHRMTSPDGEASIAYCEAQDITRLITFPRRPRLESGRPNPNPRVLRFSGFGVTSPERAKRLLDTVGAYVLFELDLTRDFGLRFSRAPAPSTAGVRHPWPLNDAPPDFPTNAYEREAIELYMYGREAQGMPLLEFLAYYQAIEFFFGRYSETALRGRIETLVKDPRFSPHNDRDVGRLVDVLRDAKGRGFGSEREQLRETLRACVETDELREFFADEIRQLHFGDKRSALAVRPIAKPDREADLRDAVAERVYQLRCKIVHTKEVGGHGEIDLLLPNSPEARLLTHDIDLARLLAARVITASSAALVL